MKPGIKGIVTGGAALVLCLASSASAHATWNFNPTCSPTNVTVIEHSAPAAMLMLDRSGSMGDLYAEYCCAPTCGYLCGPTLWDVAVGAIKQVVLAMTDETEPDEVLFGLGFFPYTTIAFEALEYSYPPMSAALDATGPGGGTPTADAINALRASATLNDTSRPSAGILITDGEPCCADDSKQRAVDAACTMRGEGKGLYVMGLGGATDTEYNNMLAAAAGTGCCGPTANAACSNGVGTDPCTTTVSPSSCFGSYQAYDQTEFRNALLSIANELACTFNIDFSMYPVEQAPEDPNAVAVRVKGASGTVSLPHRTLSSDGEGWFFSNENRRSVTLTPHYCAQIQSGEVEAVETQLACYCQEVEGADCAVASPPLGVCPQGRWECDHGYDYCVPYGPTHCPDPCPGLAIGEACHVDNTAPFTEGPHSLAGEKNRCKLGRIDCVDIIPVCLPIHRPMPELCDGLDNDCDGQVDNIVGSWSKAEFDAFTISATGPNAIAACNERDVCRCSDGSGEHNGVGSSPAEEFSSYLSAWTPVCMCIQSLEE